MTETAATNGEKSDAGSTETSGKSASEMIFDEGGCGDNPNIKAQSVCKESIPCKESVSDGQLSDDAVTSVISSLHQLALSAEQMASANGNGIIWSSANSDETGNPTLNVVSGAKETVTTPAVQAATTTSVQQQLHAALNLPCQAQKRAITGQQVIHSIPVINGQHSILTSPKHQNWSNTNGTPSQFQQQLRWQNGNLVQQQQLAQSSVVNNSVPTFSRQKRNIPGVSSVMNGQMTRPFISAQNGVGMSAAINANSSPVMTAAAATAANTQAMNARRQNLISAQYLQAALNAKALGLDETTNLLALQVST